MKKIIITALLCLTGSVFACTDLDTVISVEQIAKSPDLCQAIFIKAYRTLDNDDSCRMTGDTEIVEEIMSCNEARELQDQSLQYIF